MTSSTKEPWADAYGVPVTTAARVEQIGIHKPHGALPSRRGKAGVVSELGRSRVAVLFDGEPEPVGIRPYLLQVLTQPEAGGMTDLEGLHWHGYLRPAQTGLDEPDEPTLLDRERRLAQAPHAVLRSPSQVAQWLSTAAEQPGRFVLWFPASSRWVNYNDRAEMRMEAVKLAARAGGVYAAVCSADEGTGFGLYAEVVTTDDCPEHGIHDEQDA